MILYRTTSLNNIQLNCKDPSTIDWISKQPKERFKRADTEWVAPTHRLYAICENPIRKEKTRKKEQREKRKSGNTNATRVRRMNYCCKTASSSRNGNKTRATRTLVYTGGTHFVLGWFFAHRTPVNTVPDSFFQRCAPLLCPMHADSVCAVTGKQNVIWIESMRVQTPLRQTRSNF